MLSRLDPIPEGKVLAGVSGGADSMLLLFLLIALRDRGMAEPEVIHINHGWRGDESDADERFVRGFCESNRIPCHVYRLPEGSAHDENSARDFRRKCFAECAAALSIGTVALAHHQDDQAETFLMHLLRGAGPDGLEAMRPETNLGSVTVIRPMLGISKAEIRGFLSEAGIRWREDITNARPVYLRNRIRLRLLPQMEDMAPGCAKRIARASELIAEGNAALDEWADSLVKSAAGLDWFRKGALTEAPKAVAVRALRRWLEGYAGKAFPGITPDYETTGKLYNLLFEPERSKVNLPCGLHAVSGRRFMFLTGIEIKIPEPVPCVSPRTVFGEHDMLFTASRRNAGDGLREQEVPVGFVKDCVIRTRRTGDYLYPFGSEARQSLQDYLVNRKVEAPWRSRIPLIARGHEVLWVAGVGAGRLPRLDGTQETERLVWQGQMPWM